MVYANGWRMQNTKTVVQNTHNHVMSFCPVVQRLVIQTALIEHVPPEGGRTLPEPVGFKLLFNELIVGARVAPFSDSHFTRTWVTDLQGEDVHIRAVRERVDNLC